MDTVDSSDNALFDAEPATERRCGSCGVTRPLAMFYIAAERRYIEKHGVSARRPCRMCQRRKALAWRGPRQHLLDRIKTEAGCADCGVRNPDHPEIYDFDHLPGQTKVKNVAHYLTSGTVEDMLAEAAKCEVVCANCHRIRSRARESNKFGRDSGEHPVL